MAGPLDFLQQKSNPLEWLTGPLNVAKQVGSGVEGLLGQAVQAPVVGGGLQALGTVAAPLANTVFGVPAILQSPNALRAAQQNYRTLEGGEPGFLDIPAYSRALGAASQARAGEFAQTAENPNLPFGERAGAALGQFAFGAGPNIAPLPILPPGLGAATRFGARGLAAAERGVGRGVSAAERAVTENVSRTVGAGEFSRLTPEQIVAERRAPQPSSAEPFGKPNALVESYARDTWKRIQDGKKVLFSNKEGTLENELQKAIDAGQIKSREDIARFINESAAKNNAFESEAERILQQDATSVTKAAENRAKKATKSEETGPLHYRGPQDMVARDVNGNPVGSGDLGYYQVDDVMNPDFEIRDKSDGQVLGRGKSLDDAMEDAGVVRLHGMQGRPVAPKNRPQASALSDFSDQDLLNAVVQRDKMSPEGRKAVEDEFLSRAAKSSTDKVLAMRGKAGPANDLIEKEIIRRSGQVTREEAVAGTAPKVAAEAADVAAPVEMKLPRDLAGARPRNRMAEVKFESDIDKALYIVANRTTKSKRHDDYMKFLRRAFPDQTDREIIDRGQEVRAAVSRLTPDEAGNLRLPRAGGPADELVPESAIEPPPSTSSTEGPKATKNAKTESASGGGDQPPKRPTIEEFMNSLPPEERTPSFREALQKVIDGGPSAYLSELNNLTRTARTMPDVSALLNQGFWPLVSGVLSTSARRRATSRDAIVTAFKSYNKGWSDRFVENLKSRPMTMKDPTTGELVDVVDEAGQPISAYAQWLKMGGDEFGRTVREGKGGDAKLSEYYQSELAESIPGVGRVVRGAERSFANTLNTLSFGNWLDALDSYRISHGKEMPETMQKAYARMFNQSVGRVQGRKLEAIASALNGFLWAPSFTLSRFQLPLETLAELRNLPSSEIARRQASDMAKVVGTGIGFLTLMRLAGYQVGTNPYAADFGTARVGDTQIDIWGGFRNPAIFMARMIMDRYTSQTGKTTPSRTATGFGSSAEDLFTRQVSSRLAPLTGTLWSLVTGKDYLGRPFGPVGGQSNLESVKSVVGNTLVPLSPADMFEAIKANGPIGALLGAASFLGARATTFTDKAQNAKIAQARLLRDKYFSAPAFNTGINRQQEAMVYRAIQQYRKLGASKQTIAGARRDQQLQAFYRNALGGQFRRYVDERGVIRSQVVSPQRRQLAKDPNYRNLGITLEEILTHY